MSDSTNQRLRHLPAVGTLLDRPDVQRMAEETSRAETVKALRDALEDVRQRIVNAAPQDVTDTDAIIALAQSHLKRRTTPSLMRVVNATGIVLHTGLGRARLGPAAVGALEAAADHYCNLEFDLRTGKRGRRQRHVTGLISRLTGAEAATVVNNNAAATLLILQTMAAGREVIVSRGQLVEIGGSYRLPDIMAASGAVMREVGTTNRTRIADFERAISDQTALLLRVHTSNYRIVGFTEQPEFAELAELAHQKGLLAVDDLGSGALYDLSEHGLPYEPCVTDSLAAGADLVCFSGDKLLGGPQAGIICGRLSLIQQIEASPLMRTYRVGKLTLLALEATLRQYADPDQAIRTIPALAALTRDASELARRAEALRECLAATIPDERFLVCSDQSYAGGGSLPAEALETVVVQWRPATVSASAASDLLRQAPVPVIARVRDDAVVFDLRTIEPDEFDLLSQAVRGAIRGQAGQPAD